jgi:hypothetical protein
MKTITETEVKYLAGLIDADGCLSFEFTGDRLTLSMRISAATSIDKHEYVLGLPESTGYGSSHTKSQRTETWAPITVWAVSKTSDVEMLLPRLIKHLVIKGKHFDRMLAMCKKYKGKKLSDLDKEQLRAFSKASRADAGPVKPKKHPSWAWTAGYLDGDGSYIYSHPPSHKGPKLLIQATAHENDRVALDLLHKAFGGYITDRGVGKKHILDWRHSLSKTYSSFAVMFLTKMVQHSKLKKHKIEQLLAYHNSL